MKLETEYLGMSKLFKYAIKSYFKNVAVCLAFFLSVVFFLENAFQQVAALFCLYNNGLEIS